ncbi:MAG TPA: ABC transporter permease subunit [Gaiellaceae bacterium]|nr:ABC transporter permease subunit [Gaiellaceae bacterium]
MSTASSASPQPFRPGIVARSIAAFSGTPGHVIKLVILSLTNALAVWAAYVLIDRSKWISLALLIAVTLAVDVVYLAPRTWTLPAKFLVPGTVFLLAFQMVPIVYTIEVALSNYSTGHISSKSEAIAQIKLNSLEPPPNGKQYEMAPARDASGKLVLILHEDGTGKVFAGTSKGLTELSKSDVKVDESGIPTSAKDYTLIKGAELFTLDQQLSKLTVPTSGDAAIQAQGVRNAVELQPTLRYDASRDRFVRISDGAVFVDDGKGEFAAIANPKDELEPGWKTFIGLGNFNKLASNPLYRDPFLRVFVWTVVYATFTVFFSFAVGLFLAIALDKKGMRGQKLYRSVLVIPYAMPGFLSLLVWGGLLNDDFGVVNKLLHLHVPWLFDPNWARVSVVLVSIWLTTPYFFLVSLGALQSIPAELTEAARVDGGGGWAIFRRVTLPLLLVAVAPLMIASFAFNFNNFNNIYLLTGGGPYSGTSSVAGATDILISYTYKLAIATGKGQDYGLASTVGIVIFFIVASISGVSFYRSKSLENMR